VHRSSTDQTLSTRATRRTSARLSSRRSRVFDPLGFLAEVSAHIPDPHEKPTLFYGWYSNRTRGYRKQHGLLGDASPADPAADESNGTPLEVRRSCLRRAQARRARLIRQVYEVDPLPCSQCGGRMKVIAVIEPACAGTCLRRSRDRQAADRRPAVVRQIRSAELATKPRPPGPPHRSAQPPRATRPAR
jgi:hypothetical protein